MWQPQTDKKNKNFSQKAFSKGTTALGKNVGYCLFFPLPVAKPEFEKQGSIK